MADMQSQIKMTADATGVETGVTRAKRSLRDLGSTTEQVSARATRAIDRQVDALKLQAVQFGKTAREAKLLELASKGANAAQLASANAALLATERQEKYAQTLQRVKVGASAAALAVSAGLTLAFKNAVSTLDLLDEFAEKTGIGAEKLSELRYAGEVTGTSFEQLSTGFTKLAKNMAEAAGGNKEAQATFKALGVDVVDTEGKLRSTDAVLLDVADRFATYKDGAAKAALVQRVFGKSGEDLIPILNLGSQGIAKLRDEAQKLGAVYSGDLAKSAAEFNDNLTKIRLAGEAAAVSLSGPLIGALARLSSEYLDAKKNGEAFLPTLAAIASYATPGGQAALLATYFTGGSVFGKKTAQRIAVNASIDPNDSNDAVYRRFMRERPKVDAPVVEDGKPPKTPKAAKDNTIAAQLAYDLDQIRKARDALSNTLNNTEKVLEAKRAANLLSEGDYWSEKKRLLTEGSRVAEDGLKKEIERIQQEKVTGKERLDNDRKVLDLQSQIAKVREDSVTEMEILAIREGDAARKLALSLQEAKTAAETYLTTIRNQNNRELIGIGRGNQQREIDARQSQREDEYLSRVQTLAAQRRAGEITEQAYTEYLAIEKRAHGEALDEDRKFWAAKLQAQQDWKNGALEALNNYYDEAQNKAKHMEETVGNAFKGLEDQLTNLFTGKKFDAKALMESIGTDLARSFVQENITGPLAGLAKDFLGVSVSNPAARLGTQSNPMFVKLADQLNLVQQAGGSSSGSGWLTNLIGAAASAFGGLSNTFAVPLANSMSGDALDNLLRLTNNYRGFADGGYTGAGARLQAAGVVHRGEYVINAAATRKLGLTFLDKLNARGYADGGYVRGGGTSAGGSVTNNGDWRPVINIPVSGQVDRRTRDQIAGDVQRGLWKARRLM